VELGARFGDVCRVAVEVEPEVFDLGVAKGLEDAAVEFVAGRVGGTEFLLAMMKLISL
jgi:hypothetical protein